MQLAILHYHLNAGGVARVIHNHLLALATCEPANWPDRVVLLQGRADTNWPHERVCDDLPFPVDLVTVDGLDYDDPLASPKFDVSVPDALTRAGCSPDETLLHWHNHALGKNVRATLAVTALAEQGYKQLLQVHDFAEDFRPDNYGWLVDNLEADLSRAMYPQAAQIHYAVLNRRDHGILSNLGVAEPRLHMLPNPVAAIDALPEPGSSRRLVRVALDVPEEARLFTYPVRGIRRKNVGEMLLWSAALADTWFFLTLAPENPAERAVFDRWQQLAAEQDLRCRLGKPDSSEMSFAEILVASDALVTTSVAEGFGMAFLEPWLAGRMLLGRNLAEITSDACDAGLNLESLYDALVVPTEWVNRDKFVELMSDIVEETYGAFRKSYLKRQLLEELDRKSVV